MPFAAKNLTLKQEFLDSPNKFMSKQNIFTAMVVVAVFIAGIYLGYNLTNTKQAKQNGEYGNTFSDGWEAARQKLIESDFFPMQSEQILSLSGKIKSIGSKKITFTTPLLNPLDNEILKQRTALITDGAEIILRKQKSAEERKKDKEERSKKIQNLQKRLAAVSDENEKMNLQIQLDELTMAMVDGFKEVKAKISDLKPGYNITVEAGEDISQKIEFTAVKITATESIITTLSEEELDNSPSPPPLIADEESEQDTNIAPPPLLEEDMSEEESGE